MIQNTLHLCRGLPVTEEGSELTLDVIHINDIHSYFEVTAGRFNYRIKVLVNNFENKNPTKHSDMPGSESRLYKAKKK